MTWILKADRPIYIQLSEQIEQKIISGIYPPGSKLPSVRELAFEASVNPNTMQKALSELENSGILYPNRTAGRFVTDNLELIDQIKQEIAGKQISQFFIQMRELGYDNTEILNLTEKQLKEEL